MKRILSASFVIIFLFSFLNAGKNKSFKDLRDIAIKGDYSNFGEYSLRATKSANSETIAEYAYILAYKGLGEFSLYYLDRALINSPRNCIVRYYLSEILKAFNLNDTANEINGCSDKNYLSGLILPELDIELKNKSDEDFFNEINLLMSQKRYAEAAVKFDRYCAKNPNWRCYSGYAISLERLGSYKSAAKAIGMDISLSKDEKHIKEAELYRKELLNRKPELYSAKNEKKLKGRYLFFLGGGVDSYDGENYYNLNLRIGRFISEKIDISFEANSATGNEGLGIGLVSRFNSPIKDSPFRWTFATKAERLPISEDSFSLIISPGISYFTGSGSIDLYLDLPLTGVYKGEKIISGGYTIYF